MARLYLQPYEVIAFLERHGVTLLRVVPNVMQAHFKDITGKKLDLHYLHRSMGMIDAEFMLWFDDENELLLFKMTWL